MSELLSLKEFLAAGDEVVGEDLLEAGVLVAALEEDLAEKAGEGLGAFELVADELDADIGVPDDEPSAVGHDEAGLAMLSRDAKEEVLSGR